MKSFPLGRIISAVLAVLLACMMGMAAAPSALAVPATPDSTGTIVIDEVHDGDVFVATRIIETNFDGYITRQFAPGFSYGSNSIAKSDNGLSNYQQVQSYTEAAEKAAEAFAKQVTPDSLSFEAVADGTSAVFSDLPMGQYLIVGSAPDGSREYQKLLASIEPDQNYEIAPVTTLTPKNVLVVSRPQLEIDKSTDSEAVGIGAPIHYTVIVSIPQGSANVKNIHIVDAIDAASAASGMAINQDVTVADAQGAALADAVIAYNYATTGDNCVGYSIDIPGTFAAGDAFTIEYTGNTQALSDDTDIMNVARTWCEDVEAIEDDAIVKVLVDLPDTDTPRDSGVADEGIAIDDELTPLEQLTEMMKTGDIIPYALGGLAVIALIIIGIVAWRRRKD